MVAVEDLCRTPRWDRIAEVVGQLQVSALLAMPVRLEGQPLGTLNAYAASPRDWSEQEIDALAGLAAVTGGPGGGSERPARTDRRPGR